MSRPTRATFRSTSWQEDPIGEGAVPKMTRAHCRQTYSGDISGDSTLEYLMVHHEDGSATFVGIERIEGTVHGRQGTFAMRHEGAFADGVARMTMVVVEGAGTGALRGLTGSGTFESPHATEYHVELSCSFAD